MAAIIINTKYEYEIISNLHVQPTFAKVTSILILSFWPLLVSTNNSCCTSFVRYKFSSDTNNANMITLLMRVTAEKNKTKKYLERMKNYSCHRYLQEIKTLLPRQPLKYSK
jgi:hypothetical protein